MLRILLGITAIVLALPGCSPAPEQSSGSTPGASVSPGNRAPLHPVQDGKPEITPDKIVKDVAGRAIEVSEVTGAAPPTQWTFEADEDRHVDILERHVTDSGIELVIFMTTGNKPKPDEDNVQVSGKLRLHYEWKAGQWLLKGMQNLTFRYSLGLRT